jgi:3-oxoacyl-[acyl-carrier protein] reductase
MDLGLKNKTVLITGGSSGIGKETALTYAKENEVQIAVTYFSGKQAALELIESIDKSGNKAIAVPMSLSDFSSIEKAYSGIIDRFGSIDVLINNAVYWGDGSAMGKSFEEMPIQQWRDIISINLFGTVKLTQLVLPGMRKQQFGRIVNVSSDIALDSMVGSGPYGSLKAALFGLTSNLVVEASVDNILTNVVLPSLTMTPKAEHRFPDKFKTLAKAAFPTGRVTMPQDVASLITYLGSAANSHVNGEMIKATGKGSQPLLSYIFKNTNK